MKKAAKIYAAFAIHHDLRISTDYAVRKILANRFGYEPIQFSREVASAMWETLGLL